MSVEQLTDNLLIRMLTLPDKMRTSDEWWKWFLGKTASICIEEHKPFAKGEWDVAMEKAFHELIKEVREEK